MKEMVNLDDSSSPDASIRERCVDNAQETSGYVQLILRGTHCSREETSVSCPGGSRRGGNTATLMDPECPTKQSKSGTEGEMEHDLPCVKSKRKQYK